MTIISVYLRRHYDKDYTAIYGRILVIKNRAWINILSLRKNDRLVRDTKRNKWYVYVFLG